MRRKKYVYVGLICAIAMLFVISANALNPFLDVNETFWGYEDVLWAYENGVMNGTSEITFSPNDSMTRAMFVTVLARMTGIEFDNSVSTVFNDVPINSYYTAAVKWAYEGGIVNGVSVNEFGPNQNITREQLCTMILRYANFLNAELPQNYDKTLFSDDGSISNYAKDAVYQCQISGLVNGTGNGMFSPKGNSSRAQATAILHRFTERALFEVDAYEYLKEWVKQNGEIDGSYSQIVYQQETERYIVSYCANGDYLSVSKSYVYKGEYICLDFFR